MQDAPSPPVVPVLVARDVRRTYDADVAPVRALRGVDLTLDPGEFVALTGPSGCGKSTFLNIVAGLDQPDAGWVSIAGIELTGLGHDALARVRGRHVGIVFQFFNLVDGLTALDNVALAALIGGASRRQAHQRAHDLLDLLGLLDKAGALPSSLSGGQRQRLAIARALVNEPTLLTSRGTSGGSASGLDFLH